MTTEKSKPSSKICAAIGASELPQFELRAGEIELVVMMRGIKAALPIYWEFILKTIRRYDARAKTIKPVLRMVKS